MAYLFSSWRILTECARPARWAIVTGQPDAEAFVIAAARDLFRILGDARLTPSGRGAAFASAVGRLADGGDIPGLTRCACGSPPPPRRQGLAAALGSRIGRRYDGRPWLGSADEVTLLSSNSPRPDEVVVTFTIPDDGAFRPIQMSWRVLRSTGGWRLIDVECRGAGLAGAHRSPLAKRSRG